VGQGFDELFLGHAVFDGTAEVQLELGGVAAGGEHHDGDEAAVAGGELGAVPDVARNKGELVLLVQNAHYAAALERGRAAAEAIPYILGAVLAVVRQIVECNRVRVDNGRNYLREILFGDAEDPHRRRALEIVDEADHTIAKILSRSDQIVRSEAENLAQIVSYIMFMTMAGSENTALSDDEIVAAIKRHVSVILPG
jgi:hypothetical protein